MMSNNGSLAKDRRHRRTHHTHRSAAVVGASLNNVRPVADQSRTRHIRESSAYQVQDKSDDMTVGAVDKRRDSIFERRRATASNNSNPTADQLETHHMPNGDEDQSDDVNLQIAAMNKRYFERHYSYSDDDNNQNENNRIIQTQDNAHESSEIDGQSEQQGVFPPKNMDVNVEDLFRKVSKPPNLSPRTEVELRQPEEV